MDPDLKSHFIRFDNLLVQFQLRPKWQSSVLVIVAVRFNHCCASATECTVGVEFDRRDLKPIFAVLPNRLTDRIEDIASAADHGVNTHVELIVIGH